MARTSLILGWISVVLATAIASVWAFWGILENFHEGWYAHSIWRNLGMMLVQYLSFSLLFMALAMVGLKWPRAGASLYLLLACSAAWFFRGANQQTVSMMIVIPLVALALLQSFGQARSQWLAACLIVGVPSSVVLICGAIPAYRIATRVDDGDRSARRVTGNGVDLVWAPAGPGWPSEGVTWDEARRRCRYLSIDGRSLAQEPLDVWRLPTVDEAVRSMQRHGRNSGGAWDPASGQVTYQRWPDKESPLWDPYSPVIYWWAADEVNPAQALIIVYDGQVWARSKTAHWGYLAFRAVRDPDSTELDRRSAP